MLTKGRACTELAARHTAVLKATRWLVRVEGLGFGVSGLGFRVWGLGFRVWGLGFRVWGFGFGV